MNIFGKQIKNAREKKEWSQEQLARRLKPKCSGSYISQIEKFDKIPSDNFIFNISECLGLDAKEMLKLACKKAKPKVYEAFSGTSHSAEPSCYHSKKELRAMETAANLSNKEFEEWMNYADWLKYKKKVQGLKVKGSTLKP